MRKEARRCKEIEDKKKEKEQEGGGRGQEKEREEEKGTEGWELAKKKEWREGWGCINAKFARK